MTTTTVGTSEQDPTTVPFFYIPIFKIKERCFTFVRCHFGDAPQLSFHSEECSIPLTYFCNAVHYRIFHYQFQICLPDNSAQSFSFLSYLGKTFLLIHNFIAVDIFVKLASLFTIIMKANARLSSCVELKCEILMVAVLCKYLAFPPFLKQRRQLSKPVREVILSRKQLGFRCPGRFVLYRQDLSKRLDAGPVHFYMVRIDGITAALCRP